VACAARALAEAAEANATRRRTTTKKKKRTTKK